MLDPRDSEIYKLVLQQKEELHTQLNKAKSFLQDLSTLSYTRDREIELCEEEINNISKLFKEHDKQIMTFVNKPLETSDLIGILFHQKTLIENTALCAFYFDLSVDSDGEIRIDYYLYEGFKTIFQNRVKVFNACDKTVNYFECLKRLSIDFEEIKERAGMK